MNNSILQRIQPIDDSIKTIRRAAAASGGDAESIIRPQLATSINYFHAFVPASVRVLSVLTLIGASSTSVKGRWVPLDRLLALCCAGDEDLLLHAVRQLRLAGLITVNGSTGAARSLLFT